MKLQRLSSGLISTAIVLSGSMGLTILTSTSALIPVAQAQSAGQSVNTLRGCFINTPFTGTIAFNPTNIRQQSSTDAAIVGKFTQIGQVVNFSGITTGTAVNDAWGAGPDNMWYRLSDGRGWVASAVTKGYPPRGNCSGSTTTTNGSAQQIIDAVNRVNPDVNYRTDGKWTYCNWFAADVLRLLGVNVPRVSSTASWNYYNSPVFGNQQKPWLAENLYAYFSAGGDGKWREVNATDTVNKSNQGRVIVASIGIPPGGSDGHIAIVVPGGSGSGVRVAQAGLRNGKNLSVQEGFGVRTPRYFEYIGPR